jgi:hypothetical protein
MKHQSRGLQTIALGISLLGLIFIGAQMLGEHDVADLLPPPPVEAVVVAEPAMGLDEIVPASGEMGDLPPLPPTAHEVYRDAKYDFNAPKKMTVGQSVDISLYISLDETFNAASRLAKLPGDVRTGTVEVTDLIEVKLGGGAFEIEPQSKPRQQLPAGRTASWTWSIKAKEPGENKKLVLQVYAFEKADGQMSEGIPIETLEEFIFIDVSLMQQISGFMTSVNGLLTSIASILAILGGWLAWARQRASKA